MSELKYTGSVVGNMDFQAASGSTRRLKQYCDSRFPSAPPVKKTRTDEEVLSVLRKYELKPGTMDMVFNRCQEIDFHGLYQPDMIITALKEFQAPHAPYFGWNQFYQKALTVTSRKMNIRQISLKPENRYDVEGIKQLVPKANSHSGFTYILTGVKEKGENINDETVVRLQRLLTEVLEKRTPKIPIMVGYRAQFSGCYSDAGEEVPTKQKTRMISIIDLLVIIIELQFSVPVQNLLASCRYYAGGKAPDELAHIISGGRGRHKFWFSWDAHAYDRSIPGWLIRDAMQIIKSWFDLTEKEELLFDYITDSLVVKQFIGPEGKLIEVRNGVPSGSMFTQIVDTVVNMIILNTYLFHTGLTEEEVLSVECNICGDDNLIFHDGQIVIKDYCTYVAKNFGITSHPDKCKSGSCDYDPPEYLSKFWRSSGPWRHPLLLAAKMISPERTRVYDSKHRRVSPELIVYSYVLGYPTGLRELIDVGRFVIENNLGKSLLTTTGGPVGLSGFLEYQIRYEGMTLDVPIHILV